MPSRADRNHISYAIYLIGLSRQRLRYERVLIMSHTLALKLIKILKCRLIAPQQIQSHRYRYRYASELIETRENFTVAVRGQCQLVSAKSLNAHLSKREREWERERGGRSQSCQKLTTQHAALAVPLSWSWAHALSDTFNALRCSRNDSVICQRADEFVRHA